MDKRIHLYIDNDLSVPEKQAFERELSENRQLFHDYTKMSGLLKLAEKQYGQTQSPSDITDRILGTIAHRERSYDALRQVLRIAAVLAIVVLTGSGIFTYVHRTANLVKITFNVSLPDAQKVYLLGTFNKWGNVPEQLQKTGNGSFSLTLKLKPGIYQYVYKVNDNEILPDPHAQLYTNDGFGQRNAVLIVKNTRRS